MSQSTQADLHPHARAYDMKSFCKELSGFVCHCSARQQQRKRRGMQKRAFSRTLETVLQTLAQYKRLPVLPCLLHGNCLRCAQSIPTQAGDSSRQTQQQMCTTDQLCARNLQLNGRPMSLEVDGPLASSEKARAPVVPAGMGHRTAGSIPVS